MPIKLKNYSPKTLEEAATVLYNDLDDAEKIEIKNSQYGSFHHTVGRDIRNEWGLWNNSKLCEHFKTVYGLGHADDMSGLILLSLRSLVVGHPFDTNVEYMVEHYKKHWKSMNVDPLTQKTNKE